MNGPSFQVPMAYFGARADWCCLHEFLLVSGRGHVHELTRDGRLTSVCGLEHENLDLGYVLVIHKLQNRSRNVNPVYKELICCNQGQKRGVVGRKKRSSKS